MVDANPNRCLESPAYVYVVRWFKVFIGILPYLFIDLIQFITTIFQRNKPKNISGQVALVTGGGNGLGRQISIELAKQGCNVVIADIDLKGASETSQILIEQYNVKSNAYKVDITNYNEILSLKTKIESTLGPVDILVNNAGLLPTKSTLTQATPEETERIIQVNLLSNIWTVKIFLSGMKERRKGHIVAICSLAGVTAAPIISSYVATKFGVRGFMQSLGFDLLIQDYHKDIHTTTVFPYFIKTNEDLIDYLEDHQALHYLPILTPSYAAGEIVKAMLKNKVEVLLPKTCMLHMVLKAILPTNTYNQYVGRLLIVKPDF